MDQKHVDNISVLIHFMERLSDPRFDMRMFTHDCNTPACALGWACSIPAFQKEGLSLTFLRNENGQKIMELTHELFGCFQDIFRGTLEATIRTPQDWALHAREFLRRNGLEVTAPASDDFKHFMERVLKPVAIETQTSGDRTNCGRPISRNALAAVSNLFTALVGKALSEHFMLNYTQRKKAFPPMVRIDACTGHKP